MSYPIFRRVKDQIKLDLGGTPTEAEIQAEYDKRKLEFDSNQGKIDLKKAYSDDVYAEMLRVFGTTSTDVATANYHTYKIMIENPAAFIEESLKDDDGNQLDTEVKLSDYASIKIAEIEAYAVYRSKKFQKYKDDLKQLTGE